MFNKVANKQQSGLQCPANGKPNDGNFDEVDGVDDDNGDDDVCHADDIDELQGQGQAATTHPRGCAACALRRSSSSCSPRQQPP